MIVSRRLEIRLLAARLRSAEGQRVFSQARKEGFTKRRSGAMKETYRCHAASPCSPREIVSCFIGNPILTFYFLLFTFDFSLNFCLACFFIHRSAVRHSFSPFTLVNVISNFKFYVMTDKRNQQDQSDRSTSGTSQQGKGDTNSSRDINVENPQQGDQWDNYRTRELSGQSQGGNKPTVSNNPGGSEGASE